MSESPSTTAAPPDFWTEGVQHVPTDNPFEQSEAVKTTPAETTVKSCQHEQYHWIEGLEILAMKEPDILVVQFYHEVFDVPISALGASWAGRSLLLRFGYWIPLLRTGFKGNDEAFRLVDTEAGLEIGGVCCSHRIIPTDPQLEECWEGGILLAEHFGGWRRLVKHIHRQFTRWFMWTNAGKCISRLGRKPLNAKKRCGIMDDPLEMDRV